VHKSETGGIPLRGKVEFLLFFEHNWGMLIGAMNKANQTEPQPVAYGFV
jgi:hypothetical protein